MAENERGWEVNHVTQKPITGKDGNPLTIQDFIYMEGMYNPTLEFSFTNVLDEDFNSKWGGMKYNVKPHQSVKLPHHLFVKFVTELVDFQMQRDRAGMMLAVPAARKPYEDKIGAFLGVVQDETKLEVITGQFIEKVTQDINKQPGVPDEPIEFPEMNADNLARKDFTDTTGTPAVLERPKAGRPRKA